MVLPAAVEAFVATAADPFSLASWERGIAFREVVTKWQPGRAIAWRFDFAGAAWGLTDRRLLPTASSSTSPAAAWTTSGRAAAW